MNTSLKKKSIVIENRDSLNSEINLVFSQDNIEPYFCHTMNNISSRYKSFIDKDGNNKAWDYTKKISNNFELINQNGINSITAVNPLSRSYYKFREMVLDFDIVNKESKNINYAALAEGPGGFIESFIHMRKKDFLGRNDYIQCITLKSESFDIPNWNKAKKVLNFKNINYCYGKDNTGDLYKPENIKEFRRQMKGSTAHLVSADGGFDFSIDFNKQEQLSYKLLYAEIVTAYGVNKKDGNFILKIFDTYTKGTLKLIYLVSLFYKKIILTKPLTSRPANSERYIVCKGFRGFDQKVFNNLIDNLISWNKLDDSYYLTDIEGIPLPNSFLHYISSFNLYLLKNQIKNILKTIVFIKLKIECEELDSIRKNQIKCAEQWCKKYEVNLNYRSKYLT